MDLDTLLDQAQALPAPGIPARHGQEMKRARRISARLGKVLLRNSDPTEAEWTMLGRALLRGDAEMDDLVSWMASGGLGQGRALFEQALEHGIDTVPDAPAPCVNFSPVTMCRQPGSIWPR